MSGRRIYELDFPPIYVGEVSGPVYAAVVLLALLLGSGLFVAVALLLVWSGA